MYGDTKYAAKVNEDMGCFDENNVTANILNNCTTISVSQLSTFDRTAYYMYRLTFGTLLDEVVFFRAFIKSRLQKIPKNTIKLLNFHF